MNANESQKLLHRWQGGDESAAAEIFDRYVQRLISLAGSKLSEVLKRRVEAEDIVQSAYRSFFRNAADDRYTIEHSGQLWGLLAAITINKVRKQAAFHKAQKRDIRTEANIAASQSCYGLTPDVVATEPTSDDAAMLVEQLKHVTEELTPLQRDVFELYLQNQTNDQIALAVKRSPRTVRRSLEEVRAILEERLG